MRPRTLAASLSALALTAAAGLLIAGPLSPPTGPVTATHKTLTEVEPRIAISEVNTPSSSASHFRITQPGSYYLTGNIAVTKFYGIAILSRDVTLDLNGFTIEGGDRSIYAVADDAGEALSSITIRNGRIRGSTTNGIYASAPSTVIVQDLTVSGAAGTGIVVGNTADIRDCLVESSGTGYFVGPGSRVHNSTARLCSKGFAAWRGSIITHCSAYACGDEGFDLQQPGCQVVDCTATASAQVGFKASSGATFDRCTASGNGMQGFDIGDNSVLTNSASLLSGAQGVRVGSNCTVIANVCRDNGTNSAASGLWVAGSGNRIESNDLTANDWGLWVDGTDNIIIRNTARANTTANYGGIAAGNEMAPVVVSPGNFATANYFSNFGY